MKFYGKKPAKSLTDFHAFQAKLFLLILNGYYVINFLKSDFLNVACMTKFFTRHWRNDTWERLRQDDQEGEFFDYIASDIFQSRGVSPGDVVYVVTVIKGKLYLCGCLTVGKICGITKAAKILKIKPDDLWQANEYIIPSESTTMHFDLQVPIETVCRLTFISPEGLKKLKFNFHDCLDQQTLRGVRQLSEQSAALLDEILIVNANQQYSDEYVFESFVEGSKKQKYVTTYERNPKLRKIALRIHGCSCKGCGFNFEKFYGEHGKDFIHVHHLKPVSEFESPQAVNPETDMTVLCPNCHSMVHRFKTKTLSLEELQELIKGRTLKW